MSNPAIKFTKLGSENKCTVPYCQKKTTATNRKTRHFDDIINIKNMSKFA